MEEGERGAGSKADNIPPISSSVEFRILTRVIAQGKRKEEKGQEERRDLKRSVA